MSLNFELIHCHLAIQGRLDLVERVGQILNLEIFDSGEGAEQLRQLRLQSCLLVYGLADGDNYSTATGEGIYVPRRGKPKRQLAWQCQLPVQSVAASIVHVTANIGHVPG